MAAGELLKRLWEIQFLGFVRIIYLSVFYSNAFYLQLSYLLWIWWISLIGVIIIIIALVLYFLGYIEWYSIIGAAIAGFSSFWVFAFGEPDERKQRVFFLALMLGGIAILIYDFFY